MTVAPSEFEGFTPEAVQFLVSLGSNNARAWLAPRKGEYERLLKLPLEALCDALAARFEARGLPFRSDQKRSPFRFYRDTRFSKDKSPYKTHVGASFPYLGMASQPPAGAAPDPDLPPADGLRGNGGYFSFGPGEMVVGGGMYDPGKERLARFRSLILEDPDRVRAGLDDPGFVSEYGAAYALDSLKRVPPGFPPDHPMADRLRWKDMVFIRHLSDEEAFSRDLPDILTYAYASAMPVFGFLAAL